MDALDEAIVNLLAGENAPPGAVLGVSNGGRRTFRSGGFARAFTEDGPLPEPVPMTEDVASDLGSVTKVLGTTAALMSFIAREHLSLEAPVSAFLLRARGFPVGDATLEDLLRHRAGLWEWWPVYVEAQGPEAALERIVALPLRYRPGAASHYSDLGFMLLGAVTEACGGAPLPSVVGERVLDPLGLSHVSFARPAPGLTVAASSNGDAIERRMIATGDPYPVTVDASAFDRWRDHVLAGEVNDGNAFHGFQGAAGHAGLFAPATDLLGFGEGLLASLRGDGPFDLEVARVFLSPSGDERQGLGFRAWPEVGAIGHLGFPGVGVAILPERDLAVAMVTNRLHVRGLSVRPTEELFQVVLTAAVEVSDRETAWT